MNNKPIMVTGCQRSGTTLLNLILDSHPDIVGIDEREVKQDSLENYLTAPRYHPNVAWKLPTTAFAIDNVKSIPGVKVLWMRRDPRDVVLSMYRLKLNLGGEKIPWAVHPGGGIIEIKNCSSTTGFFDKPEGGTLVTKFNSILEKQPGDRDRGDSMFCGALVWVLKEQLIPLYQKTPLPFLIVDYEDLIANPESELSAIMNFLGLGWHDDLLEHHKLHSGISIGDTKNDRAIDSSNTSKWKNVLTQDEQALIQTVCDI